MKNFMKLRRSLAQAKLAPSEENMNNTLKMRDQEYRLERGSVESGLVLIPTTLFFLMILQVLLAGSWQTIERAKLHDLVIEHSIKESLSKESLKSNKTIEFSSYELVEGSHSSSDDHLGTQPIKSRTLSISQQDTPLGTFQLFEMSTEIPILGEFFRAIDGNLFRVNNRAVSFIS